MLFAPRYGGSLLDNLYYLFIHANKNLKPDDPNIINKFGKFLLSQGKTYKVSDIDINPQGKELIYYILISNTSSSQPKIPIEEINIYRRPSQDGTSQPPSQVEYLFPQSGYQPLPPDEYQRPSQTPSLVGTFQRPSQISFQTVTSQSSSQPSSQTVYIEPKVKILVFQEDEKGDVKQLTAASDPNGKIFNGEDLKSHYQIIEYGVYNAKSNDDTLNLSTETSEVNIQNIEKVNEDYIEIMKRILNYKKYIDNDFLYRILKVYSKFPSTGILPLDIELLYRLDYAELIKTSKTDITFKNTINTNEFLMKYFTLHEYPTGLIATKPNNVSYLDFFEHIVPILKYGVTRDNKYPTDRGYIEYREIDTRSITWLVDANYIESAKYLLDLDLDKYGPIVYSAEDVRLLTEDKYADILKYILDNLIPKNDDLPDSIKWYFYESIFRHDSLETFKLVESKFPLHGEELTELIGRLKHGPFYAKYLNYMIEKYGDSWEHYITSR